MCFMKMLRFKFPLLQHNIFKATTATQFRNFSFSESTIIPNFATLPKYDVSWKKSDLLQFKKLLPDLVRELTQYDEQNTGIQSVNKWLAKLLQYKLSTDNKDRGLAVVDSYITLAQEHDLTCTNISLSYVMGWCVEMLQAVFEDARTSKGDDKSYKDASRIIESCLYQLLWKYFGNKPYFMDVMHLFQDVNHLMVMGEALDNETCGDKSLKHFTMNRYVTITNHKTIYHTFLLPVLLALHMANISNEELQRQARVICLEMGHLYQVQMDHLNCYEKPYEETNVAKGECTWLSVVALQRASHTQKQLLQELYGRLDQESVNQVKDLYSEIGIPQTYKTYEAKNYAHLLTQIQQSSKGLPHSLFYKLIDRFYVKHK